MFEDTILRYFAELSQGQIETFKHFHKIYIDWNSKINLISRKDIDKFYLHHVLHSLSVAKIIRFNPQANILDVGTGGGFPGIPLAILSPDTRFHLVDSIGKKIKALTSISQEINLQNVILGKIRVEDIHEKYDFVLGRAVTTIEKFYTWTQKNISPIQNHKLPNGIFYMKGPEPVPSHLKSTEYRVKDLFPEDYFNNKTIVHIIPHTRHNRVV